MMVLDRVARFVRRMETRAELRVVCFYFYFLFLTAFLSAHSQESQCYFFYVSGFVLVGTTTTGTHIMKLLHSLYPRALLFVAVHAHFELLGMFIS